MKTSLLLKLCVWSALSVLAPGVLADGSGSGLGSWIGYTSGGNQATGLNSAVAAGSNNLASAQGAFVGAGTANQANGISSLVIGGFDNRAVAIDSLVGAGAGHRATGARSVIVGGGYNVASGGWSFIGGGGRDGSASTPAGTDAKDQIASGNFSTIGGGQGNRTGPNAFSTVTGGAFNTASGGFAAVGGGFNNTANGNSATVAGGYSNIASGDFSFAAGRDAVAAGNGTFVIADASTPLQFPAYVANAFAARYTGGFTFASSVDPGTGFYATGCQLFSGGGSWACSSDRETKTAFDVIDSQSILQNVADMPITRWRFQGEADDIRHIGPMAQDFRAAFGLGHNDKSISMLDAQGVALAAIQGLHRLGQEKDARIVALEQRVAEVESLRGELAALKSALADVLKERRVTAQRD
jgi:hypothetical protein